MSLEEQVRKILEGMSLDQTQNHDEATCTANAHITRVLVLHQCDLGHEWIELNEKQFKNMIHSEALQTMLDTRKKVQALQQEWGWTRRANNDFENLAPQISDLAAEIFALKQREKELNITLIKVLDRVAFLEGKNGLGTN
jgi:hypothetical protein